MQDTSEKFAFSQKQQRALLALLTTKNITEAAKAAGCSERSIHVWLRNVEFRHELSVREGDLLDQAVRRLLALQSAALDVIEEVLSNTEASQAVRLRAAQAALELVHRLREQRDTEQRLTALEQAAGAMGGYGQGI